MMVGRQDAITPFADWLASDNSWAVSSANDWSLDPTLAAAAPQASDPIQPANIPYDPANPPKIVVKTSAPDPQDDEEN